MDLPVVPQKTWQIARATEFEAMDVELGCIDLNDCRYRVVLHVDVYDTVPAISIWELRIRCLRG